MTILRETTELPPVHFKPPATFAEALRGGASSVGKSAVSGWLSCPQASHLGSLGVQPRPAEGVSEYGISALSFGTLFHALRATRLVQGQDGAERLLASWGSEIDAESMQKAFMLLRVYNAEFPLETEPFDVLGVEVEVVTNIHDWWGRPLFRTVRYDTVVRMKQDGAIFSLECKTMAKSGQSSLNAYVDQGYVHSAVWNGNKHLVEQYGAMQGTIWDCAIKTMTPRAERVGPRYFTTYQQSLALDYLRMPEVISMPMLPDGNYPKFLHTCWGRWSPCKYIAGCHDNAWGEYVQIDKETGEVLPYFPEATL